MTALASLSRTLWHQQQLLDVLLYRLEVEQLLLHAGRTCWLDQASDDVAAAVGDIAASELLRASQAAAVGAELGLGPEPALTEIAAAAPEPWAAIFHDHRAMLLARTEVVDAQVRATCELLAAPGHEASPATCQAALEVTAGVVQPSMVAFLADRPTAPAR